VGTLLVELALEWRSPCGERGSTRPSWPQAIGSRYQWHNSKGPQVLLDLELLLASLEELVVALEAVLAEEWGTGWVAALD